ncbi:hypothetical protein CPB86DRAFT_792006 [Serendipita vermifera]|nr:hypothetical protein CPB86DRAFT_792006 [Serendipita vermifera]
MSLEISTLEGHIKRLRKHQAEFEAQSQVWIQRQRLAVETIFEAEATLEQVNFELHSLKPCLKELS